MPRSFNRKLTTRQQELLRDFELGDDNRAVFKQDKPIPDWAEIKKVFELLGSKWKTGKKGAKGGFVFPPEVDADAMIQTALKTGELLDPKLAGFFETPSVVAARMALITNVKPGSRVLEPSAGKGAIARAARAAGADVDCVEILADHRHALRSDDFHVLDVPSNDFLNMRIPTGNALYDVVLMNPPFRRGIEVQHILRAWHFVRPCGGRLGAIGPASLLTASTEDHRKLQSLVLASGLVEDLPDGTFKDAGTMVKTCAIYMTKP